MNWYVAKLVFNVVTGNGNHTPQFDEQIRLIEAEDAHQAFFKARFLGASEQDEFMTEDLNDVRWIFVDVCELKPVEQFVHGLELHSRIHEADQSSSYIRFVHHRAQAILEQVEQPHAASIP